MIKNNLSQRHFLEQNNKVNNLFEHLLQQMRTLGYPETRLWINVARQSFEHELFEQIKKNGPTPETGLKLRICFSASEFAAVIYKAVPFCGRNRPDISTPSSSNNLILFSKPPAYPVKLPLLPTTR